MSRRVRVAVIGAGLAGRANAHGFRSVRMIHRPAVADIEMVAVADTSLADAQDLAERFGFKRITTAWEDIVAADDIDAVCVATPPHLHPEMVDALFAAGKHVLCEKPLARTGEEARRMADAAQRSGLIAIVGFEVRQLPTILTIRRLVQAGDLGHIRQFVGHYYHDFAADPHTPFSWRYDRSLAGGGATLDLGSHLVDCARFIVGDLAGIVSAMTKTVITARRLLSSEASGPGFENAEHPMHHVENDDIAIFQARFASGAYGEFSTSRVATGFKNSLGFTIIGDDGTVVFDLERMAEYEIVRKGDHASNGFRRVIAGPADPNFADGLAFPTAGSSFGLADAFVYQAECFIRAVVSGDVGHGATFQDGHATAEILDKVLERGAACEDTRPASSETESLGG